MGGRALGAVAVPLLPRPAVLDHRSCIRMVWGSIRMKAGAMTWGSIAESARSGASLRCGARSGHAAAGHYDGVSEAVSAAAPGDQPQQR
jgi:hypothetical protein